LIFVLFGPGGAGKGTIAKQLVSRDPGLWLSRSWTTRQRRQGESEDAYVFVNRATFESHARDGGFFEWAEFLGNYYGTPLPTPPPGRDVLLEIDLQGARRVKELEPDATLILLRPPSPELQAARMRARGDDPQHIAKRLAAGAAETEQGMAIADEVVVNDEIEQATAEAAGIVERYRSAARKGGGSSGGTTGTVDPPSDPTSDNPTEGS
jgi:guanylate kinase